MFENETKRQREKRQGEGHPEWLDKKFDKYLSPTMKMNKIIKTNHLRI